MCSCFLKVYVLADKEKTWRCVKRTLSKILPLCFLSLLLAALVCSVANDMYAFVKKEREITLTIDSNYSLDEFAKTLEDNGVVNNPDVFKLYVRLKDKEALVESFNGELKLNAAMSYREILSEFS